MKSNSRHNAKIDVKRDREAFLSFVKKIMGSMGLTILEHGVDYRTEKPDIVAIYPDKNKYYMIEALSLDCIDEQSPRIYIKDSYADYRMYCKNLFKDSEVSAAVAAALICDLCFGIEAFGYKSIGAYNINAMSGYAALAVPQEKIEPVSSVLTRLNIDFRCLDILDNFTFTLISKEDTKQLIETKKFIGFMLSNR